MKKGFTLIELLGVIVILGIVSTIAVASYISYRNDVIEEYYEKAEKTMKASSESLLTYCQNSVLGESYCLDIPKIGASVVVSLSTLTDHKFMNEIFDQKTNKKCTGEIKITNNTPTHSDYQGLNQKLEYKVCLRCDNHKSSGC